MNYYTTSALVAFLLLAMGVVAAMMGMINYLENTESKSGKYMRNVCICVFFWDFGYGWMSLSYNDDMAYVARAISLFAVTAYMYYVLSYIAKVVNYTQKTLRVVQIIFTTLSFIAWTQIIRKDAVTFDAVPWGYWYTSKMTWGRVLQFISIIVATSLYYYILYYGLKKTIYERERYIIRKFLWFGVILSAGYIVDTILPSVAHTQAVPGSAIGAFFSALLLFQVSRKNKTFGLSRVNVSEYVFRDVEVPVIATDENDKIILFNDITKQYLECDEKELERKALSCFFEDVSENEKPYFDIMGISKNEKLMKLVGKNKICKMDRTEVKDKFGDPLYYIYFLQDETKEIETYNILQESKKAAETANKAKSHFLANMSHEIRTPINAVLGMNEMIIRDSKDDNIVNYALDIESAGKHLLSIINDILDISKIESGKMNLVQIEYSLASVINDSYNTISMRAKQKGLSVIVETNPEIPSELMGDEVRVRQILTNLLTNAVKYTKEGKVILRADYVSQPDNMIDLILEVKDTGVGLTEEQQQKLFINFERLDEKQNRNIEGTGLGLSITKKFVEMMNGKIEVESVRGQGSTFRVTIPQRIVKEAPLGDMGHGFANFTVNKQEDDEKFVAPDVNILVVDDVAINIKVFKGLLKKTLINIDDRLSGQGCLEAIYEKKYDMIFLDHMMPDMDGIETFHHIKEKKDHLNVDTPVIMLTANAVVGAEDEYKSEGIDDYLSKPVNGKALEDMIKKYLRYD